MRLADHRTDRAGDRRHGSALRHAVTMLAAALLASACAAGRSPPASTPVLVGGCGASSGLVPKYVLPFPPGEAFELTQGNCGAESHGGRFRYAFDFRMPIGTPVIAARSGVVLTVRDGSPDGTRRTGDENFVIIEHADGELSRYIHLRQHGVLVAEGARVATGDTIARSGNSGRSAFPHLHFDVADRCGTRGCTTTPAAFINADPPIPSARGPVEALSVRTSPRKR